jgi:hypothetical protein
MALLLATGALAGSLVGLSMVEHEHERRNEKALRRMLRDPEMVENLARLQAFEDSIPVKLLFVRIDSPQFAPKFDSTTLRMKVKYGRGDKSLKARSRDAVVARKSNDEVATAPIQMTCVFPWLHDVAPVLKLSLKKIGGLMDSELAEVKFELPFRGKARASMEQDAVFMKGKAQDVIGQVRIHAELRSLPRGVLHGRVPLVETRSRPERSSVTVV